MSQQPKKYDVHVFAIVRVKVCDIEASSVHAAIDAAAAHVELYTGKIDVAGCEGEFADEISHYLVDEAGDAERQASTWYKDAAHWIEVSGDPIASAAKHPEQPSKLVDTPPRPQFRERTPMGVLIEFVNDVEAAGIDHTQEEWPDLYITYRYAKGILAAAMAPETDEATKFVEMVAGFPRNGECETCQQDGSTDNPACAAGEMHEPWPWEDAFETITSLIDKARAIEATWKGVPA